MTGKRIGNRAHVRRDGAAQIARQQDRTQHSRARNQIDERANEKDDSERENDAFGIAELFGRLHDRRGLDELADGVKQQEQGRQAAQYPPNPKRLI